MATGSRRWALAGAATILVAAAVVVAILVSSGGGGGSQTSGQGTGTAGGTATGRTTGSVRGGDPSAAYEAAARTALPSVVQIQRSNGLGSGVVMDGSGDIVTNAHVVAGEK